MTRYDYVCTGPSHDHIPPAAALAAGVVRTRCIACRKAIKNTGKYCVSWGAYDRAAYVRQLRGIR